MDSCIYIKIKFHTDVTYLLVNVWKQMVPKEFI